MSRLLLSASLLVVASACSEGGSAEPLTPAETQLALSQLNETCLDTWCEGPVSFEFSALTCEGSSCQLSFSARPDSETAPVDGQVDVARGASVIEDGQGISESFEASVGEALEAWDAPPGW